MRACTKQFTDRRRTMPAKQPITQRWCFFFSFTDVTLTFQQFLTHHYHHQSLNREGRWGTTDDFATNFLQFSLFSTALWDLPNSRPVHSLILSSHLFLRLPCLLPLSIYLARWLLPDLVNGRHDHTTAVCVSLRSSGGLHVVQLPAGSWHGLPRW